MVDQHDPCGTAAAWRQAADNVRELRRDDSSADAGPWSGVIDRAVALLGREASDARAMGGMAYLLIVGNGTPSMDSPA